MSPINRWRIFDNLRRTLVPAASILLLLFGWFFSVEPGIWSMVLALAIAIPAVVPVLDRWTRHVEGTVYGWQGAADDLKRAVVLIAFLPHQAWLSVDAIVRVLHRRLTRRRLLEWRTAEDAESGHATYQESTQRQMWVIAGVALTVLGLLTVRGEFAPTFGFLALWIASPWLVSWLGRADEVRLFRTIGNAKSGELRVLARRTWRYFDDLVNADTHWLPPDNTQLALRTEVARRTSPTNIGLWLNSVQAAHSFGYVTVNEFVRRCGHTLESMALLERYEGHLLNWYELDHLQPLPPRYVSTVDSGNLIASKLSR